jgi:hypothetical protein
MAMGPGISGLYMQSYQTTIPGENGDLPFPSGQPYDFIFLTATSVSFISIILELVLKKSTDQVVDKLSSLKP